MAFPVDVQPSADQQNGIGEGDHDDKDFVGNAHSIPLTGGSQHPDRILDQCFHPLVFDKNNENLHDHILT
ncbi:hypothetical protein C8P63_11136 [Melghirimyces profundicolus]|uniref:Uncharacterized protein n=1 Tax=Melghirimyces profundicolus TaxID=1242148 RepID=A0A2T6BU65_9BACL|nr:hypothetical protein [Melghirimyces profundicolus]PTX59602.1 hypothetical protein C8P63_11136 [Melghirimyces profundicolus]